MCIQQGRTVDAFRFRLEAKDLRVRLPILVFEGSLP